MLGNTGCRVGIWEEGDLGRDTFSNRAAPPLSVLYYSGWPPILVIGVKVIRNQTSWAIKSNIQNTQAFKDAIY